VARVVRAEYEHCKPYTRCPYTRCPYICCPNTRCPNTRRPYARCPYTLYPAPCTLHPVPCTLHLAPYIVHLALCTLHYDELCTLHPTPCIVHPALCTLYPAPYAVSFKRCTRAHLGPALDDLAGREGDGLAALVAAVEHGAVQQLTFVVAAARGPRAGSGTHRASPRSAPGFRV